MVVNPNIHIYSQKHTFIMYTNIYSLNLVHKNRFLTHSGCWKHSKPLFSESATRWRSDRITRVIWHARGRYHRKGFEIVNTHIYTLWGYQSILNIVVEWYNFSVSNATNSTAYGFLRHLILPEQLPAQSSWKTKWHEKNNAVYTQNVL